MKHASRCVICAVAMGVSLGVLAMTAGPQRRHARADANVEPIPALEHVALNVKDAPAVVAWFVANLDMKVVREFGNPPDTWFVADKAGRSLFEIYSDKSAPVPDYAAMHPLTLHFAFSVRDVAAARDRLLKAGAAAEGEITRTERGDTLAMVRSPQGLVIQLMHRAKPML